MLWDDRLLAVIPLCVQNSWDFEHHNFWLTIGLVFEKCCSVESEPIVKLVHWISVFYTRWILDLLKFIRIYRQSDIRMYSYHCPDIRGFGDWPPPTDDNRLGTGRRPPALRPWPNTCSPVHPRRPANRPHTWAHRHMDFMCRTQEIVNPSWQQASSESGIPLKMNCRWLVLKVTPKFC